MIVSENSSPEKITFQLLMKKTDDFLNNEAKGHENYFQKRTAQLLEEDVYLALSQCAKGTQFENTIQLVSGSQFPDIIASGCYGVEVKSTIKNHWTSTGSSILESTRIQNVEKIFMTFGKLGSPVQFKSKPYEQCLSEIAVTHYPRYKIDMNLSENETIFVKMGISYDELRKLENPVVPVSKYYKSKLKPGERLWWSSDADISSEKTVPVTVRLFSSLEKEEKDVYRVLMVTMFPSVLGNSQTKYDSPSLWLLTQKGVFSTHIRDEFSAGGQVEIKTKNGIIVKMPAIFGRIEKFKNEILEVIETSEEKELEENWHVKIDQNNRIKQWCELCAKYYSQNDEEKSKMALNVLYRIFSIYEIEEKYMYVAQEENH